MKILIVVVVVVVVRIIRTGGGNMLWKIISYYKTNLGVLNIGFFIFKLNTRRGLDRFYEIYPKLLPRKLFLGTQSISCHVIFAKKTLL